MDPLTLLAYFLLCLIVLGIAWYAMQWDGSISGSG
jgi:hypothetical protein